MGPWSGARRPTLPAGRCRRPNRDPGTRPTLMCQVLTTRARDRAPTAAVLAGPDPGARPPPPAPSRPPASGLAPVTRRSGSSIRGKARLPRRQQAPQVRHARLRLAALRPRFPGLPPAQTRPRQNALGQVVPAPAPHRIPTPHVMTRNDTLHDPQPATKPPTAARHTTQGHPHHRARGVGSKRRRRARNDHVYFLVL